MKNNKKTLKSEQKSEKSDKGTRGITLIALVITVIVMLILAGVAISLLTDDGGIFEKTRGAAEAYENAAEREAAQLNTLMNEVDQYLAGIPVTKPNPEEPTPTPPSTPKPAAQTVQIGDYVNYDAGVWTAADLAKITNSTGRPTLHSTVNDATTGNQTYPREQGQFGGFELGQSRNTNSAVFVSKYTPRTAGWRVWDIDSVTKEVTLISAGHSETYFHLEGQTTASMNILKNRNCTMYENAYAKTGSAHILTGQEAATWYNARFGTNYTITENEGSNSTFYKKTFSTDEPISVLENGSDYWLASAYGTDSLYYVKSEKRYVYDNFYSAFGVRVLLTLKSDVLLEQGTGNGSVDNPWKISQE